MDDADAVSRPALPGWARPFPWLILLAAVLGLGTSLAMARPIAAPGPLRSTATTPAAPLPLPISAVVKARPIPAGFVGLSLEYRDILTYGGPNPKAVNPLFVRLIQNLAPGQTPVLRIGGDSTDWSWWPVPGVKKPPGVTYTITPGWIASARALAQDTGAQYILGVNLEAGNPRVEKAEARALLTGITWRYVEAVELGNEPELYAALPWYKTATGERVRGRPRTYNFLSFNDEFLQFHEAEPWIPLAGPSSGSYGWLQNLPAFLTSEPTLKLVTVHSYWLNRCARSATQAGYPSVPHLLSASPPSRTTGSLAQYAAIAHAHGMPIRIDEMNSVTCGGEPGVSDVFASALWALNALFEAAGDNIDGVNIHTFPGTANQLFSFVWHDGAWTASVRPEYYGLLMFTQAMPPGARLLRIFEPAKDPLRAWGALDNGGTLRIVLINDSLTAPRTVVVEPPSQADLATLLPAGTAAPSPDAPAQLEQLIAASPYATSGITLGGDSFGAATTTGTLAGTPTTSTITPASGAYTVTVPAASAAMLTLPPATP
jgi:hypothetical protein